MYQTSPKMRNTSSCCFLWFVCFINSILCHTVNKEKDSLNSGMLKKKHSSYQRVRLHPTLFFSAWKQCILIVKIRRIKGKQRAELGLAGSGTNWRIMAAPCSLHQFLLTHLFPHILLLLSGFQSSPSLSLVHTVLNGHTMSVILQHLCLPQSVCLSVLKMTLARWIWCIKIMWFCPNLKCQYHEMRLSLHLEKENYT